MCGIADWSIFTRNLNFGGKTRRAMNPAKLPRVSSLLDQWSNQLPAFETAVLKNYKIDRVLSRDIPYPAGIAATRAIESIPAVEISAEEVLAGLAGNGGKVAVVDLRDSPDCAIAAALSVPTVAWRNPYLLTGIMGYLKELAGTWICVLPRGHPDHVAEEAEISAICVQWVMAGNCM